MRKTISNTIRAALLLGTILFSIMLLGTVNAMSYSPTHQAASVPYATNATQPQGINTTLNAYIYGVPTASNPFSGYSIAGTSSPMPPSMYIMLHGYGNSTVNVVWTGSSSGISSSFSWTTQMPFNPGRGVFLVEITIYSMPLKISVTQSYTINVMNYTQYISYEKARNPVTSTVTVPWYVLYESDEAGAALAAIMVTGFYFYAQIQWDNKEKKQKFFKLE